MNESAKAESRFSTVVWSAIIAFQVERKVPSSRPARALAMRRIVTSVVRAKTATVGTNANRPGRRTRFLPMRSARTAMGRDPITNAAPFTPRRSPTTSDPRPSSTR